MKHNTKTAKVIVGMSGGVDSSLSALLLMKQGYQVEGLFMKNWDEDDGSEYCSAKQDLADAQAVCDTLGIPLHQANFASEYWDNVFEYFLSEYRCGRTPNPDILCNREIKFKVFREYAAILESDYIATGHYARLESSDAGPKLLKGRDPNKDQSYFLHAVDSEQFSNVIFPLGDLQKSEVRKLAKASDLPTHAKKDSTGICFIGERRFRDFLRRYLPAQPGLIKTRHSDGNEITIGEHSGLMYYTIGQRQGLGIGGLKDFTDAAWFVSEKDLASNTLYVVQGGQHPDLLKSRLICQSIHWINKAKAPALPLSCQAKIRYRQDDQPCTVSFDAENKHYLVSFSHKQRAITPGQYAVFYEGDTCLGGGIISEAMA